MQDRFLEVAHNSVNSIPEDKERVRSLMSAGTTVIPSISGIAALDFMHALEELVGAPAYARALARLAPELREELTTVTAMSWLPNDTVNHLIDALAAESGKDPDQLIEQA